MLRLRPYRRPIASLLGLPILCGLLVLASHAVAQEPSPGGPATGRGEYRVRITLRSPNSCRWQGQISALGGGLSALGLLSTEYDAARDLQIFEGVVQIQQQRSASRLAFDVNVPSSDEAELQISLATQTGNGRLSLAIPVRDVLAGPVSRPLGSDGAMVQVTRLAADSLRVETDRDQLIFSPNEQFTFSLGAVLPQLPTGAPLDLSVTLSRARQGQVLWESDLPRRSTPVSGSLNSRVEVPLPADEGVYTVNIKALRPPGSVKAWLPGSTGTLVAERRLQLVVFDALKRPQTPADWNVTQSIDPTNKHWWDRLPRWVWLRRAPWLPEGPLGNSPAKVVAHPTGQLVELPPRPPGDSAWQAYPAPIREPGQPYLLEVEYPTDSPQHLVLTVIDQDNHGNARPLGSSAGIVVGESDTDDGKLKTVRKLFWPRSQSPLLVISNGRSDVAARYGRIRLLAASQWLEQNTPSPVRNHLTVHTSTDLDGLFGATLAEAAAHEDWQTYYETAVRLADYAGLAGHTGAVITVASAEGALYPSQVLPQLCGLDREYAVTGAADLPQKDAVELLCREFDRRGLRLVPSLRFESLPALEKGSQGTSSPRLSALSVEAQALIKATVEELLTRYGHHESLAGVAIEISEGDYASVRDEDALLTNDIFNRFMADSNLTWPASAQPTTAMYAAAIEGPWKEPWGRWRDLQIAKLYYQLADLVAHSGNHRRLLVCPDQSLARGASARSLRPRLDREPDYAGALLARGLNITQLSRHPSIILGHPRYLTGTRPLEEEATLLASNAALEASTVVRSGVCLNSPTLRDRLSTFAQANPFDGKSTSADLAIAPTSHETLAAHAALTSGPMPEVILEGGDSLPLVLDDRVITARRIAQQVPLATTATESLRENPITVSAHREVAGTRLAITNPSPWAVDVSLTLRTRVACGVVPVLDSTTSPQRFGAGEHVLQATLAPYQVKLLQFDQAGVKPTGLRLQTNPRVEQQLRDRITELKRRNLNALSPYGQCPNPSFEDLGFGGEVVGWQSSESTSGGNLPADQPAAHGERCLILTSTHGEASVQSNPFAMPTTGQLATVFRVRGQDLSQGARLRVWLSEMGQGYRSFTVVPADQITSSGSGWRPFVFSVDDLPIGANQSIRLGFDLIGTGTLQVDHLEMYDLVFPLEFLGRTSAKQKLALVRTIHRAESALESGKLLECHQILQGYWPRFLLRYTPEIDDTATRIAKQPTRRDSSEELQKEEEVEERSVGDRLRGYLPGFLKF